MTGDSIDQWCKSSRVSAARSGVVMLLALLSLLLPVLAQAATPVAVSDPQLRQLKLQTVVAPGSLFGCSMSVSGNTAVVGAPSGDNSHAGAVYVFVFANRAWRLQQQIYSPSETCDDKFGISVSVSGDNLIIGAPDHGPGAAYIYGRSGEAWTFVRKFEGEANGDKFGCSVSVSRDVFLVGADHSDKTLVLQDGPAMSDPAYWLSLAWLWPPDTLSFPDSGAAYLIARSSVASWDSSKIDPCAIDGANFGCSVSISGNTAIIGAKNAYKETTGGGAYVFDLYDTTARKFLPRVNAQSHDLFGECVAISGDTVLIGAPGSDGGKGSAVLYTKANGSWGFQSRLTASDGAASDYFGDSVSLSEDSAAVGAPYVDSGGSVDCGSVYCYTRSGTAWNPKRKVSAATRVAYGRFGSSVGIFGSDVVVGEVGSKEAFWCPHEVRYVLDEDTSLTVSAGDGVLANDQYLSATARLVDTSSLHGTLSLASDGSFVYRPQANFNGTATATYCLISGATASNTATITIVVNPVNYPPVARDDVETTTPDGVLLELADEGEGLLANDSDVDPEDTLTISFRPAWPKHAGWCGVLPDGSFSYVPRAGFIGTDTFDYTITDGHGGSDSAKVSFKVGTGEPPAAMSDSEINQFKLFSVDPGIATNIGWSVAISGDTAIVGTNNETTPSVYAYNRSGSVWNLEQRILPPYVSETGGFGTAVSVSGNTLVIGAASSGKVHVYTKPSALADWRYQTTLQGPALEDFGCSVSISGDTLVVGAKGATVNGCTGAGAAYVYQRTSAGWSSPTKLTAANPAAYAQLGSSVSVSGIQAILGAPGSPSLDVAGIRTGGAFVFTRNGTQGVWDSGVQLPVSALPDNAAFGCSVAMSGSTAVVGAWNERDYDNDRWGAAYVFVKGSGRWTLQNRLTADGARSFGNSVSISENTLIVGAPGDGGLGPAAYVYNRSGNAWAPRDRLASRKPGGQFGWAVCASDRNAIVGAPFDDEAGSAYVETGLSPYVTDGNKSLFVPASSGVLVNDRTVGLKPALVDTSRLHGSIDLNSDGSFVYAPQTGFIGTATATYRVSDGERTSDPATITIIVNAPNRPPIARDDAATVVCGKWLRVPAPGVLANASDSDGDPLTISLNKPAVSGLSLFDDGSYEFRAPQVPREVSFSYTLSDGRGGTAVGTVKISVVRDELKR